MKLRTVLFNNPNGDTLFKEVTFYNDIPVTGSEVIWGGNHYLVSHRVEDFDKGEVRVTLTAYS